MKSLNKYLFEIYIKNYYSRIYKNDTALKNQSERDSCTASDQELFPQIATFSRIGVASFPPLAASLPRVL